MSIGPNDVLANGTKVRVGTKRGEVVSHKIVRAIPSGSIVVHTIRFTERGIRGFGSNFKWVEIKPIENEVNYSFIKVEN